MSTPVKRVDMSDIKEDIAVVEHEISKLRETIDDLKEHSISDRVWDLMMKIAIPVVFLVGARVIAHEVAINRIETELANEREARADMRGILKDLSNDLRRGQEDILKRVTVIETKLEK